MFTKKSAGLLFGALFLFAFLAFVVSAQTALDNALDGTSRVSQFLSLDDSSKEVFTKFLMMILLFMIIFQAVSAVFSENKFLSTLITLIVTILAVWWLPVNFISSIRITYGAMGAAILSVVPFLIMLVFTARIKSLLVAKALWIFFVLYYFGLAFYEVVRIGRWNDPAVIPYYCVIGAGIAIFFGLPKIRELLFGEKLKELQEEGEAVAGRSGLLHKLQKKELAQYSDGGGI